MPSSVLNKSGFVTKTIATVLPHTVEMSLMFPITTISISTILSKPELKKDKINTKNTLGMLNNHNNILIYRYKLT
jgi:hypothetical protein